MKRAVYKGKLLSPSDFETVVGHNWRDLGVHATCRVCGSKATPVATHSVSVAEHFRHEADVTDCPYSSRADERFAHLMPQERDPGVAEKVKAGFLREREKKTLRFIRNIAHVPDVQPYYDAMLAVADRLRIWEYRGIQQWAIPFILLTLIDFDIPTKGDRRAYSFQFRFIKRLSSPVDLLWTEPGKTMIEKVFIPSGIRMNRPEGNPWPVSEETLERFGR